MRTNRIEQREQSWATGKARTITFIVTENCQLRCRYCYVVGKNAHNRMSFDTAKTAVEFFLKQQFPEPAVVLEFIGGEPLLEIELIRNITDYFKRRAYELNHKWFSQYRLQMTTNGLAYSTPRVQAFIEDNRYHTNISLTIDGTPVKHNINRVFPDGSGSYDKVVANVPLWVSQFPESSTKVTISSDDLPYLSESVLHLWSLGIRNLNVSTVFEDVWLPTDPQRYEEQLVSLADHILKNDLYVDHRCSLFDRLVGKPHDYLDNRNFCGTGSKMTAIGPDGTLYPCIRFAPMSLSQRKARSVGNIRTGLDHNRLRPFLSVDRLVQSPPKCRTCRVSTGCAWCIAGNYDNSATGTIFERSTFHCGMHKARVRANDYFWKHLDQKEGLSALNQI